MSRSVVIRDISDDDRIASCRVSKEFAEQGEIGKNPGTDVQGFDRCHGLQKSVSFAEYHLLDLCQVYMCIRSPKKGSPASRLSPVTVNGLHCDGESSGELLSAFGGSSVCEIHGAPRPFEHRSFPGLIAYSGSVTCPASVK